MTSFVLASASPRRSALLSQCGFTFEVRPADIDETPAAAEAPERYVLRMADGKAAAGLAALAGDDERVVLAADTTVVLDGAILGKPMDADDAGAMLRRLAGRRHRVITAVCVADRRRRQSCSVSTEVWLRPLDDVEVRAYVATGEGLDKAGSYAVQGLGSAFVQRISGSYGAVVGLPLCETVAMLRDFGIQPDWLAKTAGGEQTGDVGTAPDQR